MKVMIMIENSKFYKTFYKEKKKLKINNILIEKYKKMLKNPDFEQNHYSITSTGICKIGHDSIRLLKCMCYFDRSLYENNNQYDLRSSICKYLIDNHS